MKKSLLIFSSLVFVTSGLFSENVSSQNYFQVGLSSWYGDNFQGRLTASGERFDKSKLTAAHRELPLGSIIKVKNLENQKEVLVTINDRGPFAEERIMDVTEKAAEELEFRDVGIAKIGISLTKSLKKDNEPDEGFDEFLDSDVDSEDEEIKISNDSKSTEEGPKKTSPPKKEEVKKETPKKESKESKNEPKDSKKETKETKNESKESKSKSKGNQPKGFTVQLGVFKSEEAISKFKDLEKIFNEKVFTFTRDDAYVVQIGDFPTRKAALEFQKKVRAKGFSTFVPLNK